MYNKFSLIFSLLFLVILLTGKSFSQSQSLPVNFSSVIFANYSYSNIGTEGKDANKFDLERLYLTAKYQFAEDWKAQLTTDVFRNTAANSYYSGLSARIKFGFVDYSPWSSLSIKAGLIPGPWNSVVESVWKYRGVAATSSDKYGYVATADIGVSAVYLLPSKYGEIAGYIYNGEGFTSPETNRFKDFVLRTTLVPFPADPYLKSFTVAGYAYLGRTGTGNGLVKQRLGGLLGYGYSVVSVGGEYNVKKDGMNAAPDVNANVLSVFGEIKAPFSELQSKLSFIWRYDISDPNQGKANDKTKLLIAGLVWKTNEKVTLSLDNQTIRTESPILKQADGTLIDKDQRWFVHMIVNL